MPESIKGERHLWAGHPAGYRRRSPTSPLDFGIYLNAKFMKDTAAGDYTGVANGLIQRPTDMINALLCEYGGVSTSDITNSGFGSFATARTELDARITAPSYFFSTRIWHGKEMSIRDLIAKICIQCGLSYIEPFDGKHRLIAWKAAPSGDNYVYRPAADGGAVKFSWGSGLNHIRKGSFKKPQFTKRSAIINEVTVNYNFQFPQNTFMNSAYVDASESEPDNAAYETKCSDSQSDYNIIRHLSIDADFIYEEDVAVWLTEFAIDMLATPKLVIAFDTGINASDLMMKQVFELDADVDAHVPYPVKGSDGSWAGKQFWCEDVRRMQDPKSQVRYSVIGISV